jgi:hypothetical protein
MLPGANWRCAYYTVRRKIQDHQDLLAQKESLRFDRPPVEVDYCRLRETKLPAECSKIVGKKNWKNQQQLPEKSRQGISNNEYPMMRKDVNPLSPGVMEALSRWAASSGPRCGMPTAQRSGQQMGYSLMGNADSLQDTTGNDHGHLMSSRSFGSPYRKG